MGVSDTTRTVDACINVPGMVIELGHFEWREVTEIDWVSDEVGLVLTMRGMPDVHDCVLPDISPLTPYDVGYLALWTAGVRYINRIDPCRLRFLQLRIDPTYFAERTGLGGDWRFGAGLNITGTAIDGAMLRLAREAAAPGFAGTLLAEGLGTSIIADVARFLRGTSHRSDGDRRKLSQSQVRRIAEYVESAEGTSPTISGIADVVGVSRRHLTRVFKKTTGQTLHDYVVHVRLRKACTLLCGTDLTMKEIAYRLGFASHSSFSYAFRAATGQAPTAFRQDLHAPKGDFHLREIDTGRLRFR